MVNDRIFLMAFRIISDVRMELITSIAESSNTVFKVFFFVDLGGSFSEHFSLQFVIVNAHIVYHMRLHFTFAHTFLCEYLWILSLSPHEHDVGVCCGVDGALSCEVVSLLEIYILIVFRVHGLANKMLRRKRKVLRVPVSLPHQVVCVALLFISHLFFIFYE